MRYFIIFLLSLFSLNLWATEVAVLDFRTAVLQSEAGKEAAKAPQAKIDSMQQQLKQEQQEIQDMSAALKRDELTLTKEDLAARQKEITEKSNHLRNAAANMQRQAQQMEQQLLQSLKEPAEVALKKIIEERKFDLIINNQAAVYIKDSINITNELTKRMNEAN